MGLAEELRAGASLDRTDTIFTTSVSGVGSFTIAPSYAIIKIEASAPCRLRLYDNQASRDDATESARVFGDTNIGEAIALIGDFDIGSSGVYTVDPTLYSVSSIFSSPTTYYRVSPASAITIKITAYNLEDVNFPAGTGDYTINNRRTLPVISATLASGSKTTGTLTDNNIPQTYLLVSSSANNTARLRIYSNTGSLSDTTEINRPFSIEPSASAHLIMDTILYNGTTYFTPKIIGANLSNMGENLLVIRANRALLAGENEIYYILENITASPITVSAYLHVFSLED
jgi:hypothetical protein